MSYVLRGNQMKYVILIIVVLMPFLQGCGLSGAYIYFGDRSWSKYLEALKDPKSEQASEYLRAAYGNYNDSLTYDDRRYPLVYKKLADAKYKMTLDPSASIRELKRAPSVISETPELLACLGKYTFLKAKASPDSKNYHKLIIDAKDYYRSALLNKPLNSVFNSGLLRIFFFEIEKNKFEAKESKNNYLLTQVDDLLENVMGDKTPQVEESRGINAYVRGDFKLAIEKLSAVVQGYGYQLEDSKSPYYLARSYVEDKNYAEAIEIASTALQKDEGSFLMRGERTLAYFMRGDTSAGTLDLEWMEKNVADYHEFYFRVGALFSKQNLSKKAELYLLKAFRLNGSNGNYAFALGQNSLLEGNTRAAKKFFGRAKALAPAGSNLEKRAQQKLTEIGN